ncbi:hypothetical protein WJX79_008535 [Trebouxia sp. C0005]
MHGPGGQPSGTPVVNQTIKQQPSHSFELRDQNDTSRDTAAAAEAKNAEKGVASGSTRKDASDTGRPSEAAPTASESVPKNVKEQGLHGNVKGAASDTSPDKAGQCGCCTSTPA